MNMSEDTNGGRAPRNWLRSLVWPVALFALMVVALQWPRFREMIYGSHYPEAAFTWQDNWQSAQQMSSQSNKPILLVFSASWCPPCQRMKRTVWPDEEVGRVVQSEYVPMYVDVDLPQHEELVGRYNIQGIPSIFLVDHAGNILRRGNFMDRSEMLSFLDKG